MFWYDLDNIETASFDEKSSNIADANKSIKKIAIDIAKKNRIFRLVSRKILFNQMAKRYKRFQDSTRIDDKLILFCTFSGRSYGDSPKAIYEYMLTDPKFDEYTFVWAFQDPYKFKDLLKNPRTFIVKAKTASYEETCAKAKYWMFNYRVDDHIYPKDEQVYVQLWHGTPLKKLGYDIINSDNAMNSLAEIKIKYDTDASKFKYILAPSDFARDKFTSAWNLKAHGKADSVIVKGYPRNDYLSNYKDEDIDKIKDKLGVAKDKKIIFYAPTWRDNQHDSKIGYTYEPDIDFDLMKKELGDEYIILFRIHYLAANKLNLDKYKGFVYDVSDVSDINELYIISDMLLTDYSSVFFDYANLGKPILFYMYDYDEYLNELRGFYIDTEELPGPIVQSTEDVVELIKNIDNTANEYKDKYDKFKQKYNYLDDGQASKRVAYRVVE